MSRLLCTCVCLAVYGAIPAQGAPSVVVAKKPSLICPRTEMGDADLQVRYEQMWTQYSESVEGATKNLEAELEKQTKSATGSGNLDLALFWKGLAEQYDQTGELRWDDPSQKKTWKDRFGKAPFPEDVTDAVQDASESYASALQSLEKGYEELVKEFTKADKLKEAVKVRSEGNALLSGKASTKQSETAPKSLREHRADRQRLVSSRGGNASSEASVDSALKWLILHQQDDGGWSFASGCDCRNTCHPSCKADRAGATGLALLPFLARGYTHKDGPYKKQLGKAVGFLADVSNKNQGNLVKTGGGMSSQSYATLALSECEEMTSDKRLSLPRQLALNFIREKDKDKPGWGAIANEPGDTLTTASVMSVARSIRLFDRYSADAYAKKTAEFLNRVQYDEGAQYGLFAPEDRPPAGPSTSAGLASRLSLGWKIDHPALQKGVTTLFKRGPADDILYNYYATNVLFAMAGDRWIAWNSRMRERLVTAQSRDGHSAGSWLEGFDNSEEAQRMGRLYVTALATLILEVYYRYPGL